MSGCRAAKCNMHFLVMAFWVGRIFSCHHTTHTVSMCELRPRRHLRALVPDIGCTMNRMLQFSQSPKKMSNIQQKHRRRNTHRHIDTQRIFSTGRTAECAAFGMHNATRIDIMTNFFISLSLADNYISTDLIPNATRK